jgi:hypothetical protein
MEMGVNSTSRFQLPPARLHQVKARSGRAAVVAGLGKFAADAGGFGFADVVVPGDEMVIGMAAAYRWFGELYGIERYRFDFEGLEFQAVRFGIADILFSKRSFGERVLWERGFGDARFVRTGHGDVDVLEDAARCNAEHAVGGFDEVIAFASAVLAAEVIDEAERGTELFGFDQEACAVCLPLL